MAIFLKEALKKYWTMEGNIFFALFRLISSCIIKFFSFFDMQMLANCWVHRPSCSAASIFHVQYLSCKEGSDPLLLGQLLHSFFTFEFKFILNWLWIGSSFFDEKAIYWFVSKCVCKTLMYAASTLAWALIVQRLQMLYLALSGLEYCYMLKKRNLH